MQEDAAYLNTLDTVEGPELEHEKEALEQEMGFSYRQALGEALFAMVTCRPDISFPVIKLSKFANRPAKEHYAALKKLFRYLRSTINDGIIYWRRKPTIDPHLKQSPIPQIFHHSSPPIQTKDHLTLIGSVDSDWASDVSDRKSVSGIIMHLAGGTVHYKTSYQNTVAHSSTEAEFVAACDATKMAIYVRSLLDQIGIPQIDATLIFEDNTGALMMANA